MNIRDISFFNTNLTFVSITTLQESFPQGLEFVYGEFRLLDMRAWVTVSAQTMVLYQVVVMTLS